MPASSSASQKIDLPASKNIFACASKYLSLKAT